MRNRIEIYTNIILSHRKKYGEESEGWRPRRSCSWNFSQSSLTQVELANSAVERYLSHCVCFSILPLSRRRERCQNSFYFNEVFEKGLL